MDEYLALDHSTARESEANWSVCMSVNYPSKKRLSGVMPGNLAATEKQPKYFDNYKIPGT